MEQDELDQLYQALVFEHSKKPRNFGTITNECTCHSKGKNPSCGDNIDLYIKSDGRKIEDIKFVGEGCALSISSTSILTELIKGKDLEYCYNLKEEFINFITKNSPISNAKLEIFKGVSNFPLRVKCVLLGWRTLENSLEKIKNGN